MPPWAFEVHILENVFGLIKIILVSSVPPPSVAAFVCFAAHSKQTAHTGARDLTSKAAALAIARLKMLYLQYGMQKVVLVS